MCARFFSTTFLPAGLPAVGMADRLVSLPHDIILEGLVDLLKYARDDALALRDNFLALANLSSCLKFFFFWKKHDSKEIPELIVEITI